MEDFKGRRFERLLVLKLSEKRKFFYTCKCDCGEEVDVHWHNLKKGTTKSCGCLRRDLQKSKRGEKNPSWKGGSWINRDGYEYIRILPEEELSKYLTGIRSKRRYLFKHQMVMSTFLGRPLDPRMESVHHKNGDRLDNRIENLELMQSYHPRGQLTEDLEKDAIERLLKLGYKIYKEGIEINGYFGY